MYVNGVIINFQALMKVDLVKKFTSSLKATRILVRYIKIS